MVKNRQEVLNMPRRKKMDPVGKSLPDERHTKLTARQKSFATYVVEGVYSNAECARKAAKDPSSRQIVLFSGSKGPELIAKPYQEVQGSWFDGPAPLFEALRPEIEEHFRRVLRPAPCD
jgi:hypothetical protein